MASLSSLSARSNPLLPHSSQDSNSTTVVENIIPQIISLTREEYPSLLLICRKIKVIYYGENSKIDDKVILQGIKLVLTHEHKRRFYRDGCLQFKKEVTSVLDALKTSRDGKSSSAYAAEAPKKEHRKTIKTICNEMTALYIRPTTLLEKKKPGRGFRKLRTTLWSH